MPTPRRSGRVIVYTGDGKGKTTAALGLALRAVGRGMNVAVLQFLKSPERTYGEQLALRRLGIEVHQLGAGFTWTKTADVHRQALQRAWTLAKQYVHSGQYDLIVLDELNNALAIDRFPVDDIISVEDVLELIRTRPPSLHLVITGRSARPELIAVADIVTEMTLVKHDYEQGEAAMKGIEF
ncbi:MULTISPECIES: cob(I)yrinic acid a,c-diamide adenosyltransferase [Geobacillus]|jgi:cob(I)alamin adenosyltransferase|uniref:ATP:corrinoid adenosyltransferase n=1 Tax=Geobacillus thermodenitrificans (strain NG80-2) TaxID=420246 RepID=A4INZ1_GEOTN|nr:cob(I)yrinic acid a,c-diamide adenosyltransferase [Geobacillus thermodenitrificans]ABO67045.1 ATP:corrinoid adenosyltransferase [Geobacillus thermodenitrificans NG80-2]MED0661822.1 cob(I)yrinic acid a,c-diamide adenosyltransferase [Geobacillus thermodenitrificans]MED3718662.1 cob(I)yrinic acid a,c-diamide adenosyltransferase [Geobacillus thermodenitrificans]MED4919019.1 cob(I)yrinic acid a,c-diamide adenosyltransferase [Geobacillus thermodenitrificans]PJW20829.1 cob(I)yrinic acid a,c-diamid